MAIHVHCVGCNAKFQADDRHAGKIAKCPRCQQQLKIPAATAVNRVAPVPAQADSLPRTAAKQSVPPATSQPPSRQQISQTLLNGFQGPIKRSRPSIAYLLSALVVALFMLLLPLIYLGIIALVGYGVYFHAVNDTGMLAADVRGRAKVMILIAYLAPIVCGAIAVVFMIKPLFARRASHSRTRSLVRESEPLLFAFVDRICETVGAPRPKRIDLDCQVNASAMFRRGLFSMLGSDLVLTIGMPLVAGLNTRQFAGVLAHEFGHFSQGAGMRLSYIIRAVSFWFARVVYQRDAADEWLAATAQSLDIRLGWVLHLANALVWLTRRILWVLMHVGHLMGSHLMRQMEFDADRYEIRLAGTDAFVETSRRLRHLDLATQAAFADLREFYREGRLGDDLPQLIVARVQQIPPKLANALEQSVATATTGWLDTHPADKDRIEKAYEEKAPGVFVVEMPASVLLSDFSSQSKATTWEYYREMFGPALERSKLRPIGEILAKNEQFQAARGAIDKFFAGGWSVAEPLRLQTDNCGPPTDPKTTLTQLAKVRASLEQVASTTVASYEELSSALGEAVTARQLLCCLRAGMKITFNNKKLTSRDEGQVKQMHDKARRQLSVARNTVAQYQKLAAERLALGLQLFHVPKVAQRIPKASEWASTLDAKFDCFRVVADQLQSFMSIVEISSAFNTLVQHLVANNQDKDVAIAVENLARELFPLLQRARSAFQNLKYPYDHASKDMSLSNFLVPEVPIKEDLASLYHAANQLIESTPALYQRLLGDLVQIATAVETAVGLGKTAPSANQPSAESA